MKKSIAIMLLVATSVVAIAVGAGIWYTRPSAPLAIIEEAKARQRQPLLEVVPPPARAEAVEVLPADYSDLVDELLPLIQDRLAPQQAPTTLSSDQRAYVDQAVEALRQDLLRTVSTQVDRSYVDQQVNLLKGELKELDAKQVDHQALIASITAEDLRPIFSVYKNELLREVRSEQPRTTVVMSGEVDESVLFNNLAWEIEDNLDFYATYARDAILATIDQDDLIALYESYRPLLVADLATSLPASTTTITQGKDIDEDELFAHFAQEIDENKAFYATYVRDAVLETISDEDLLSYYSYYRPALVADLGPTFAQVPVTMVADTQQILGALASEVEANKSLYATYVRDAVLETISDDELIDYYSYYRPALVADLGPTFAQVPVTMVADNQQILGALASEIEANKSFYATYIRDAVLETISDEDLYGYYTFYRPALVADLASEFATSRVDAEAIIDELLADIEANKSAYAAWARDAIAETISDDDLIDLYLTYRGALVADLLTELPAAQMRADAQEVLGALFTEIETNKPEYAAYVRDAIIDTISDEDLIAYYLYYRPELLEDIYQGLRGRFGEVRVPPTPTPATSKSVPVEIEPEPQPEVSQPPVLIVEEIAQPTVVTPTVRVPAPPAAMVKPSVILEELTSAEYEALRQDRRTEALEEVFGKIK